jgi:hypothetical protein
LPRGIAGLFDQVTGAFRRLQLPSPDEPRRLTPMGRRLLRVDR